MGWNSLILQIQWYLVNFFFGNGLGPWWWLGEKNSEKLSMMGAVVQQKYDLDHENLYKFLRTCVCVSNRHSAWDWPYFATNFSWSVPLVWTSSSFLMEEMWIFFGWFKEIQSRNQPWLECMWMIADILFLLCLEIAHISAEKLNLTVQLVWVYLSFIKWGDVCKFGLVQTSLT